MRENSNSIFGETFSPAQQDQQDRYLRHCPDIYIKHTVTKQNNVYFIDDECPALTVKYQYYINNTVDMFNRFLLKQHKIGYRSNNKIESYLVPAWPD